MIKKLCSIAIACGVLSAANASVETIDWYNTATPKAQQFLKDVVAIDFYASPYKTGWDNTVEVANYIDLAYSRGITGASITIGAPHTPTWDTFKAEKAVWEAAAQQAKTPIRFVNKPEDYALALKNGEYAIQWNSQTTMMLEGDASRVKDVAAMGIKSMQLVYNEVEKTGVGVVSMINGNRTGLTKFGQDVIDEMVKHGITVDMSHTSYETTKGITDYMQKHHKGVPAIYSHSPLASTYGCQPHETLTETQKRMAKSGFQKGDKDFRLAACYRLISDQQAKTVAEMGGVISVTATEWMMDGVWPEDITPAQFAQMIDGAVKVVGVDHVGIATDDMMTTAKVVPFAKKHADKYADNGYMVHAFDQGSTGCAELSKHLAPVVDELWKLGYSNEDLKKIFGGNLIRVYKQTWK